MDDEPATRASTWAQIMAVARRDLTIQLSYQVVVLLRTQAVFFSLATLVFLGRLVPSGRLGPYGGGYFEFALIGLVVGSFTTLGLRSFTSTISSEQQEGTLEVLVASSTRMAVLLAGTMIVPLALAAIEVFVYVGVGVGVVGDGLDAQGLLLALPVFVLTVGSFAAIGILSAAFVLITKRGDPVATLVGQATAFLGGAVFPVALLPGWVQALAHLVPAYYSLDGFRRALLGPTTAGPILFDVTMLAIFTAALLPVSLWLFSKALTLARTTGTLGTY